MEDVDKIIIDSLRHLNCPIDEKITYLKQFDNNMVIKSIMACIDVISPGTGFPHYLPASMSQRLKLATNIADHIKELGFRGDIGYQMILYCNEVEIRRLLMFLIEKLPRELDKTSVHADDSSKMCSLVKSIRYKINKSLKTLWVPSEMLRNGGIRNSQGISIRFGYGHCYPLHCKNLHIPNTQIQTLESNEMKQYSVHNLPDVTKQCSYKNLIPSLLFNSVYNADIEEMDDKTVAEIINKCEMSHKNWPETITENLYSVKQQQQKVLESSVVASEIKTKIQKSENDSEVIIAQLAEEIETGKQNIIELKSELEKLETQKSKLLKTKAVKEKELEKKIQDLNIKSKSHSLLSNRENINKLKLVVENGTQKLVDLANQWYAVQNPLLNEYRSLMQHVNANESEAQNLEEKLQNAKLKCRKANEELKDKDQLLLQLTDQYNKLNKQTNRSAYTRRIMETISNIKKQSNDIDKILKDTREVQKEINSLTGQLERSFALSDEIIFRDAKQDESAKKAYKLLASMHSAYEEVIQASSELGAIIRESRNLMEQVDAEEAREISARLDRVIADLNQVRNETASLMQQHS